MIIEKTFTYSLAEVPSSRLRSTVGLNLGRDALKATATQGDGGVSAPRSVRGELLYESRVRKRCEYLRSIAQLREKSAKPALRNWHRLLEGNILEVSGGVVSPDLKRSIARSKFERDQKHTLGHQFIDTGVDYERLKRNHPTERYKFYHSFGDSDAATNYLTDVINRAGEQGISMSIKSYDHAYDGVNIYTYHFQEMQQIVQEVYASHLAAWGSTEHFLQGVVPGVDPSHIGWVQEPVAGLSALSHSGRMGALGRSLDSNGLSEDSYVSGCAKACVRPDQPWLLTPEYEAKLKAEADMRQATR